MRNNNSKVEPKAPYRFVPLHEKIVSPYWKHGVSHDVPFLDGETGVIEVEMTAYSDIFVSNGKKDVEDKAALEFSNFNGNYFIPASSIKGMIRNVVEIIGFGGMKPTVENNRYAFRDLNNVKEYRDHFNPKNIFCGYLRKEKSGEYIIRDCGTPGRISQSAIDKYFRTDMATAFDKGGRGTKKQDREKEKSALYKYEEYAHVAQDFLRFDHLENNGERLIYEISPDGEEKGKIVFTGQPSPNKLSEKVTRKGKHYEFIFFEENCRDIVVDKRIIENFKFAYFEKDKNNWSVDWDCRRKQLRDNKEIPVFFQVEGGKVKHLGLSYLYKLPYANDIHQTLAHTQKKDKIDLARLIFGYIDDNKSALKGRVNFSHAWLSNDVRPLEKRSEVLSSPRASYYPFYLKQDGGAFQSYMSSSAQLAGWKKYPIHKTIKKNAAPNDNEKILVHFKPLPQGAKFTFKIAYHNLKKVELGALVSAITFHNTEAAFHNIGMAKPLGYGKIKLKIKNSSKVLDCLRDFEFFMNQELKTDWRNTEQMKELIALCIENEKHDKSLTYMDLEDFTDLKKEKKPLRGFHTNETLTIKSALTGFDTTLFERERMEDEKMMQRVGSYETIIYHFQEREKELLREAFKRRQSELISYIEECRKKRKQEENVSLEKGIKENRDRLTTMSLEQLTRVDKLKDLKDLSRLVTRRGRYFTGAKNDKELYKNNPNGFIRTDEDIEFIQRWLSEAIARKKRFIKGYDKPFGENNPVFKKVIGWIGEEEANKIYLNLIK